MTCVLPSLLGHSRHPLHSLPLSLSVRGNISTPLTFFRRRLTCSLWTSKLVCKYHQCIMLTLAPSLKSAAKSALRLFHYHHYHVSQMALGSRGAPSAVWPSQETIGMCVLTTSCRPLIGVGREKVPQPRDLTNHMIVTEDWTMPVGHCTRQDARMFGVCHSQNKQVRCLGEGSGSFSYRYTG